MATFEGKQINRVGLQSTALFFAKYDERFNDVLTERIIRAEDARLAPSLSSIRRKVEEVFETLEQGIQRGANCAQIRAHLKSTLSSEASKFAIDYTKGAAAWVQDKEKNEKYALPYPPNLAFQRLPRLETKTLPHYFAELEKVVVSLYEGRIGFDEIEKPNLDPAYLTNEQKVKVGARRNLEYCLGQFIERGDQEALEVLRFMLQKRNPKESPAFAADMYFSLFCKCLEKLKSYPAFVGALINLMYEEVKRTDPQLERERLTGKHAFTLIIEGLKKLGLVREISPQEFTLHDPGKPRKACHFSYAYMLQGGAVASIEIPGKFCPDRWNEDRLVDPRVNTGFREWSTILAAEAEDLELADYEAEMAKYRRDLSKRHYGLDFARLKVSEIPCPEGYQVWLNYFYDDDMPPGYIGVELVLQEEKKGGAASVVYILDGDLNLLSPTSIPRESGTGRPYHPVTPEVTGALDLVKGQGKSGVYPSVEHMYLKLGAKLYDWTDQKVHQLLRYYFARYAHALLIKNPKEKEVEKTSHRERKPNDLAGFNLSLHEYFSEIDLPIEGKGGISQRERVQGEKVLVFSEVRLHRRRLLPGELASEAAKKRAEKAKIDLEEGRYTCVKAHPRGHIVTQNSQNLRRRR